MKTIIFILSVYLVCQSSSVRTFKKSLHYPYSKLTFSYTDERFAYAYCAKDHPDDEVECTVVREKKPYHNDTFVCSLKLKVEKSGNILGSDIKVKSFGEDKVILLWSEIDSRTVNGRHLKLSTVQLKSCKVVNTLELKVDKAQSDPTSAVTIVDYEDSYDVFVENSDFCDDKKICRVNINTHNGQISRKVAAGIETRDMKLNSPSLLVPIDKLSTKKGLVYLKLHNHILDHFILKSDGSKIPFAKHQSNVTSVRVTTTFKTIGICYTKSDSSVNCTQHDLTAKLKLRTTLSEFNRVRRIEAVHNLPDGGLLFLARQCEGPNCNNIVVKIDSSGENVGVVEVSKYGCGHSWGYDQRGIFYENNEDNEYCVSLVCYGTVGRNGLRHEGRLELIAKCFTDGDF